MGGVAQEELAADPFDPRTVGLLHPVLNMIATEKIMQAAFTPASGLTQVPRRSYAASEAELTCMGG
jgi:hypothetical protein